VLERGLELLGERLGLGQSEHNGKHNDNKLERLKETGTSVGTLYREVVPASSVVETGSPYSREQGSPTLKSRTVATVSD
jgi:hypothetical protein